MGSLGGFGGLFAPNVAGMKKPVLVSGTDGVGTKLKVAQLPASTTRWASTSWPCARTTSSPRAPSRCSSSTMLQSARTTRRRSHRWFPVIAEGCRQAGCALIGGETAEMPGSYPETSTIWQGFSVGMVDKER